MAASDDGESVDAFLERIASLKLKRDREDEERTRKLEEEILQGRRDRQARRAERARSLSPPKDPMTTSSSSFANSPTSSTLGQTIEPPVALRPSSQPKSPLLDSSMDPVSPTARDTRDHSLPASVPRTTSPTRSTQNHATALSRSGTLSWQQRPSSRDSNSSRTLPSSGLSAELLPPRREPSKAEEPDTLSRVDIAQSLGSKDPTWFRQTADRGIGSLALRRNQEETMRHTVSAGDKMRLPGLSRDSTVEPEESLPLDAGRLRATSPLQNGSSQSADRSEDRFKPSYSNPAASRSPLPLSSSQRPTPSESDIQDEASVGPAELPPSQSKAFSDRPPSPTKGLGGFVQSAMMKRSDSVNKRWSTQAASGLKRGDSIASQRGTLGGVTPVPLTRGGSPSREVNASLDPPSSPRTYSRPTSSHSTTVVSQNALPASQHGTSEPANGHASLKLDLDSVGVGEKPGGKTEPPLQASGDSFRSMKSHEELPVSPTKTMDHKRWSPTKASWLESALSKPESPKITSPKVEQPTWRSDLQKSKQSKVEPIDNGNTTSSAGLVNQPGLMRSPPLGGHSRPLSIGGLPEGFSAVQVKTPPIVQQKPSSIREESSRKSPSLDNTDALEPTKATITPKSSAEPNDPVGQETAPDVRDAKIDMITNLGKPQDLTSKQNPPALKPKPQTPPKTDFRANLKSRQKDSQGSASEEPEFKNVFGKLRRTETKNYVAPDVLKSNILTGKAALSLTGGPQQSKRVDDFKESILSKKEAMKSGGGSINKKSEVTKDSLSATQKPAAVIPEALARRNQLSKATGPATGQVDAKPSVHASISAKPVVKAPLDLPKKASTPTEPTAVETSQERSGQSDPVRAAAGAAALASSGRLKPIPHMQPGNTESSDKAGSGKLANRMNPSLASILMKGPPSNSGSRNQSLEDLSTSFSGSAQATAGASHDPGQGQLTHMTKGRAKGPKRRMPKTETADKEVNRAKPTIAPKSPEVSKVSSPRPQPVGLDGATPTSPNSLSSTASPFPSRPLAPLVNQNEKIVPSIFKALPKNDVKLAADPETANKPRPIVTPKSPDLRKVSSSKPQPTVLEDAAPSTTLDTRRPTSPSAIKASSPGKRATVREQAQSPASISKGTKNDQTQNEAKAKLASKPQLSQKPTAWPSSQANGLGLELGNGESMLSRTSKHDPPLPQTRTFDKRTTVTESPKRQQVASVTAKERNSTATEGSAARQMLEDFFGERPKAGEKADIDTHAVVSSNALTIEKTKTLRMQIWEIDGDGKRKDMPPQQEHILYEESMYLCVHSFESARGSKTTEAYLWCGDNVGEAAVEDTQLFCRKIARENNAKLELLKQGKETPLFIQALGGIIITRRSKSSSLYMLCGRRHLGHVTFDEVDIAAKNLCSGFSYLISARFGKLYLWKGKGSGADEVGCARLIGMDLGLTGEIEEVNEGEEPGSFWEAALGTSARVSLAKWSDHWYLKGRADQYSCRLFRIEVGNPKPAASFWTLRAPSPAKGTKTGHAQEITPFCQRDLEAGHVFVLDAYFEIYVFVGSQASSKSVEFVTALFFAQEYSILTASVQDRPLVPPGYIVLSEPLPDFQAVFRKWSPGTGQTGLSRTTIPLNAAIEALAG